MYRFLVTASLLCVLAIPVAAQQSQKKQQSNGDFDFEDMPQSSAQPYFGVGLGFGAMLQMPDFSAINSQIQPLGIPALDKNYIATGISGFVTLPFLSNVRIGAVGYSGNSTQCADLMDTVLATPDSVKRTAVFTEGFWAITPEYVFPLHFTQDKVVIVGGVMLGMGTIALELDQTTSAARTYDNFFDPSATANFVRQIHAEYFAYQPYINIEYAVLPYLMIRAGVGYNGTAVGTWQADRSININGVPSITGNSVSFNGGIFLGIFQ